MRLAFFCLEERCLRKQFASGWHSEVVGATMSKKCGLAGQFCEQRSLACDLAPESLRWCAQKAPCVGSEVPC